jgi:predicted membrane channel-forming protein YqfA (hemolysin III family)
MWVKSKEACVKLHKLDLIGILFLILGSGLCIIYYEFMCMPFYRNIYIILNSLIAVCVLYTMVCGGDFVRKLEAMINIQVRNTSWIAAAVFIAQVIFSLVPIIHWVILSNNNDTRSLIFSQNSKWLTWEVVFFATGVFFFVKQIPENSLLKNSKWQLVVRNHFSSSR